MKKLIIWILVVFFIFVVGSLTIRYWAKNTVEKAELSITKEFPCFENIVNPRTGEVIQVLCKEADEWRKHFEMFPDGSLK